MPKKTWTAEERAAFAAKMKAAREQKTQQKSKEPHIALVNDTVEEPTPNEDGSPKVTIGMSEYEDLVRQINELKNAPWQLLGQIAENTRGPEVKNGKLMGTVDKFPMAKELYPSPVERLREEPKLQRFAFKINYELNYEVSESAYTTIDNIRMQEPKFKLELVRVMLDEDTGEPTSGRYVVCQLIMHEDPDTALVLARQLGLEIEAEDEMSFLNEMRYIRMRDWLLECFYPPKIEDHRQRRDMVIDGKLVSYFEVNNESGSGIQKQNWDSIPKVRF